MGRALFTGCASGDLCTELWHGPLRLEPEFWQKSLHWGQFRLDLGTENVLPKSLSHLDDWLLLRLACP